MRIQDLRPGDRLAVGDETATLISWSVPHPTYPGLALVVWRMNDGRVSIDALDPEQHDPTGGLAVPQSEDQRLESLRRAIEGPIKLTVDSSRAEEAQASVRERLRILAVSTSVEDRGLPFNAVFDNQPTERALEVRHYIGLAGGELAGCRMSMTLDGPCHDAHGRYLDPRDPVPLGRWRTPQDNEGPFAYPVPAEVAAAWMGDDDVDSDPFEDDDEDDDEDDL